MIRALWHDSVVYVVGTVLSRGIALLLLPLVTTLLSPAEYGALDLIVTLGVLVNLVVPLEISQGLARLWYERPEGAPRRRLASTAWTFTAAGHAVFAALCSLAAAPIAQGLLGNASFEPAVRAGGCAIAFNGMFYLLQNQFRWEMRPRAYAAFSVGYALANLVLVAIFAWALGAGLEGVLWAQAIAAAGASALSLAALRGSHTLGIARDELVAMLRFSLPLVPAGIAIFASFYANRLVLNALADLQGVGLFGIASRLASVATLVLVGFQGALTPLIYLHHNEPTTPASLARLFEGFSAVAMAACLALGLFGSELVALLATPEYTDAAPLLGWLAAAALLAQMYIFAPGIAIAKKTHWQFVISLGSALASVGLNILLIPHWGIWGAALATLIASILFFAAWLAANQRLYPMPLRLGLLATAVALFLLLSFAAPLLNSAVPDGLLRTIAKSGVLLAFVAALFFLGLVRPREWRRALAAAH